MHSKNKQQGSGGETTEEKGFAQVPHDMTEFFSNPPVMITQRGYKIVFALLRELNGWNTKFKPIKIEMFMRVTGLSEQAVHSTLSDLVENGVVVKKKIPGVRTHLYGFNEQMLKQTFVGKSAQTWQENTKVIDLVSFKLIKDRSFKLIKPMTKKHRRSALGAPSETPIYRDINIDISLNKEIREFLETRNRSTKTRWERVIQEILKQNPQDSECVLAAINRIETTHKDFMGNPIRCSVLGLFEKAEWPRLRTAFLAILQEEKEEQDRALKRKEQDELIHAARERHESEIDINNISPLFRRFAVKKGGNSA